MDRSELRQMIGVLLASLDAISAEVLVTRFAHHMTEGKWNALVSTPAPLSE